MSDDRTIVEIVRDLQSDIRRLEERVSMLISGSPELGSRGVVRDIARIRAEIDVLRLWLLALTISVILIALALTWQWIGLH